MIHAVTAFGVPLLALAGAAYGADYEPDYLDEEDPNLIDLNESVDYEYEDRVRWQFDGDLRGGYFVSEVDRRDGTTSDSDEATVRVRYGANLHVSDRLRLRARLVGVCSTEGCSPNPTIDATPANGANVAPGDIVLDELYVDLFRRDRFDLVIGRMQTNANTRGGVFISSLTRMTSPNVSVNWTDGAAFKFRTESGWNSRVIVQYNDEDGSSTLARAPLDFSDDGSRWSLFYSLENRQPWGPFTQRAVDVSFLPSALQVDGTPEGPVDDYWNVATRLATEWPLQERGDSLIVSGEIGYAPTTQTAAAAGTGGSGDAGGVAWHVEASWMNFAPGHSLGVNYGRADAGWLISPVYRPNDETAVLRYHWRPIGGVQLEVHARWRKDLESVIGSARDRKTFDWRVRLTWALQRRTF